MTAAIMHSQSVFSAQKSTAWIESSEEDQRKTTTTTAAAAARVIFKSGGELHAGQTWLQVESASLG